MPNDTPTPRTDAYLAQFSNPGVVMIPHEFTRQLERELAEAKAKLQEARHVIDAILVTDSVGPWRNDARRILNLGPE